jgi:serine/threonine protein phosphatase PrpC
MKYAAITDKGMVRKKNEDNYRIISDYMDKPSFFIIADGMGGHSSGEIASKIAVEIAENHIKNSEKSFDNKDDIVELINSIIIDADSEIQYSSHTKTEREGMGTTFIIMVVLDDIAYIGHIGDSRVYLINDNIITKVTTDHSYVEELLKTGSITEKEAKNHPKKNLITRALGHIESDLADIYRVEFNKNNTIIMCTDGLTNKISNEEILEYSEKHKMPYELCRGLVDKANERGGEDNITVIAVRNC